MKLLNVIALLGSISATIGSIIDGPEITGEPVLQKRAKGKIVNKQYLEAQRAKKAGYSSSSDIPQKWIRTIYSTQVEIVTPTVIAGVTFGAKPPATTDGLEPWISLNKKGEPKTIKPKNKNGRIEKPSPTYGTWFQTATTIRYEKEDLKAHNMKDGEVFEELKYIDEDLTYHSLNPIIRCTPDRYHMKGMGKDISSEPFCTPYDNEQLFVDKTYFITWYSRFYEGADKVQIHLSYVKESVKQKGTKRSEEDIESDYFNTTKNSKRSSVIEAGGKISEFSFYATEWIDADQGYYPLEILKEWLKDKWDLKVMISILPNNVDIDEFNYYANSVVVEMRTKPVVSKGHQEDLKKLEEKYKNRHLNVEIEESVPYEKYITIMLLPTCVVLFSFGMFLFVKFNKRYTDLSGLKKRKFARENTTHRRIPFRKKKNAYSNLPQYNTEISSKAE